MLGRRRSDADAQHVAVGDAIPVGDAVVRSCAAAWVSSQVYVGGNMASFKGHNWTARWWIQGDTPGGAAGVWTDDGACT